MENEIIYSSSADLFFENVAQLIEKARSFVGRTVDVTKCMTYFEVGRRIVEEEQDGEARAKYGKKLIPELSAYLTSRFGSGFSESTLINARKFYNVYSPSIPQAMLTESKNKSNLLSFLEEERIPQAMLTEFSPFTLSWSHYLVLMRIKNPDERRFYEIEATNEKWDYRHLQRQYNSSLYERLALSRNKEDVMRLANEGQIIEKPSDLLKNPLSLEFLGLEGHSSYSESDLEQALINNLQKFLLELGKGFLFEARQKRFTFDEDHFMVDLVFYNRLLQCYVIIDLKTKKIKHQDLGQMQMYVNYFDRFVKTERELPTVGILLCKEKNDSVVKLTLPKDSNIYASEYKLYLPDKDLLQEKLVEWTEDFEEVHGSAVN
ncbi:MAG: PDDEXK nuclease domain-containing protein [Turicibacter sp.]|nr:PDDEXK nuclease domain-containing protein [Turicibacter sp.]